MLALVISDTHGNTVPLERLLKRFTKLDMVFHLGDVEHDEDYIESLVYNRCHCPSLFVKGNMDFDVLKLDLVFLRSLGHNPKTSTLMTYIIEGATEMGLAPLCEGVETEEHFEFLKKVGCVRAQGYYFGKAMPMEETRAFTRAKGLVWESAE